MLNFKTEQRFPCELAVVAIGVRPNIKLAQEAGIEIGKLGGILVDEHMQTNDPDIYAAGDCCEIKKYSYRQKRACSLWRPCKP